MHAKKDLAFLQRPTKVGKLFRPRNGCAHLGEKIPLDGIGMDTTSVVSCVHLPECAHEDHQSFLPRDHDTLSAIQLLLPSKELPLQLNGHRM
jgi:hypothetical protein